MIFYKDDFILFIFYFTSQMDLRMFRPIPAFLIIKLFIFYFKSMMDFKNFEANLSFLIKFKDLQKNILISLC